MKESVPVDYLVVGHICRDITPTGYVAGGTAVYSAGVAHAMGCRTAVVTSTSADDDFQALLPGVTIHNIQSERSTTFENIYTPDGRQQRIHSVAKTLTTDAIPEELQRATIVHLGPIANEIEPDMIRLFSNSLVGLTPQGWYRHWDNDGNIFPGQWSAAKEVLPFAAVVILSMEDIPNSDTLITMRQLSPLVVLTQKEGGCTVYFRDEKRHFQAPSVTEVNPTGAGDIFATAYLIRLYQTKGNPWEAASFANKIASHSVTHATLEEKLTSIKNLLTQEV